jgi:amino-acid N-acetyltransferase
VDKVHEKRLQTLLDHGYTPLLQPLGMDSEGTLFNLRAVEIAAHTAQALRAAKFILLVEEDYRYLGNAMGFLDTQELDKQITALQSQNTQEEKQELLLERLQSALQAAQQGIERIHLVHAVGKDYLLREIFTKEGDGLLISGNQFSHIRRAQAHDTETILDLLDKTNQLGEFRERRREEIATTIEDFFVFEIEGTVCGAVALHPLKNQQTAELAALVVEQNYRHLGIGKKLISFLLQFAQKKGMKSIFAMTTRAQQFFLEQGFREPAKEETPQELVAKWNSDRNSKMFCYSLKQSF